MNPYGFQHYKEQSVNTMTPGELLLLLYDELLKRLKRAELALQKEDYGLFDKSMTRCQEIVSHLKDTLNFEYEISGELNRMYDFFLYHISRTKASKKPELVAELKPLVMELRDAFAEVEKMQAKEGL